MLSQWLAQRPAGDAPAQPSQGFGDFAPSLGVTGDDHQQRRGRQSAGRLGDQALLAGMGAGGQQHPAIANARLHRGERSPVHRQGVGQALEVELARDMDSVLLDEGAGLQILGVDHLEQRKQGARRRWGAAPARGAVRRDPSPEQGQLRAAVVRALQQIGPELALDEDGEGRAPMPQEPPRGPRCIDWGVLMDHALGQAAGHQLGRRARRGGDQQPEVRPRPAQALDQRQVRQALADADGMDPDQ